MQPRELAAIAPLNRLTLDRFSRIDRWKRLLVCFLCTAPRGEQTIQAQRAPYLANLGAKIQQAPEDNFSMGPSTYCFAYGEPEPDLLSRVMMRKRFPESLE